MTAVPGPAATSTAGSSIGAGGTITPAGSAPGCPSAGNGGKDSGGVLVFPRVDPQAGQNGCVVVFTRLQCRATGNATTCANSGVAQYTVPAGTTRVAV